MKKLMIYGAAGYTGAMVAEHAASAGLDLILAGREQSRKALKATAAALGAEVRVFSLDGGRRIDEGPVHVEEDGAGVDGLGHALRLASRAERPCGASRARIVAPRAAQDGDPRDMNGY